MKVLPVHYEHFVLDKSLLASCSSFPSLGLIFYVFQSTQQRLKPWPTHRTLSRLRSSTASTSASKLNHPLPVFRRAVLTDRKKA